MGIQFSNHTLHSNQQAPGTSRKPKYSIFFATMIPITFPSLHFHPIVPFEPEHEKLVPIDFTEANASLTTKMLENVPLFCDYMDQELANAGALYGIGGYAEHRTVYSRSRVFDDPSGGEPRRLHLGVDIWGKFGTPVFAPCKGKVHSLAFNKAFGDYGATIILEHTLENHVFYTLYGHLSLADLHWKSGQNLAAGQLFAHFGKPEENGQWPPHLHFQFIWDMQENVGDYPGVCRLSEKDKFLANCPDPDLMLNLNRYLA